MKAAFVVGVPCNLFLAQFEKTRSPVKAPMHLWIVGAISLLWNGFGAFDYLMPRDLTEPPSAVATPAGMTPANR